MTQKQHDEERRMRTGALIELIRSLADTSIDIKEHHKELISKLHEIYDPADGFTYRHQYSEITRFLYQNFSDSEGIDALCEALAEVKSYLGPNDGKLFEVVDKLIDHIALERLRVGQMEKAFNQGKTIEEVIKKTDEIYENVGRNAEKQKQLTEQIKNETKAVEALADTVRNHNIETITVLSIFAGIVFAFSGGLSMLGGVFSNIAALPRDKSAFFLGCLILFGMIVYDCIALLLRFTNSLVNSQRQLGDEWKKREFAFNLILMVAALILFILYYCGACA